MPGSDPKTGDVYYYPYLWKRQGLHGESEKDRPCCVALRLTAGSYRGANVFMLALSQSGYPADGYGFLIPPDIISGLRKLDRVRPTYLVMSEFNADTSEHPSFVNLEYIGSIPVEFMKDLLPKLIGHIRNGSGEVNRTGTG